MDILITLTMKEADRHDIIQRLIQKRITEDEARKLLGLKSVRQIRRIKDRVLKEGAKGLAHRGRGRSGNRKLSEDFKNEVMAIVKEKYSDFRPTFAAEKLRENHHITISRETLRQLMTKEGLWKPKSRKQPKGRHVWRARKENYGEMQQFDGSYHRWFEDRGEEVCLLLAIDDATGKITKAKFDKNEGITAVFNFWLEYFEKNGLPVSIYLDKFSTYKINHPAATDNKGLITQFQRAMSQVGVNPISAHSPEAKGRVERVFETLQDRLVKELRLAGISTAGEANKFLKTYISKFNEQFAVAPEKQADLHRGVNKELKTKLPRIFSIHSQRRVNNDYTILFKNKFLQLLEEQSITVYKKDTVSIEEYLDGEIRISHKDHYLNYKELPERPKKIIDVRLSALTAYKSGYIPPANHPWRKFQYPVKKVSAIQSALATPGHLTAPDLTKTR